MPDRPQSWLVPDWPAPPCVRALVTTRHGGFSTGPYASMNLGMHVRDDPDTVRHNRVVLRKSLPEDPKWLIQVHGVRAVDADRLQAEVEADAAFARRPGTVCAVTIADCVPVLFTTRDGSAIAAAHAGWRGLAAGVLESTIRALAVPPRELLAWLGPGIGPRAFEVGEDVRDAFVSRDRQAEAAFRPSSAGKWSCDLFLLSRQRLQALGMTHVYGGDVCTYSDPERFFSHRRDGITGRMAALIWMAPSSQ